MQLDHSHRRFLSRRAWQIYLAFYALGVYLGLNGPLVIPFVVAVPMLGVAAIFTFLEWGALRQLGLVSCAVAFAECVLAWFLLRRQPELLLVWAWGLAMLAPLVLTFHVLRVTRPSASPKPVARPD